MERSSPGVRHRAVARWALLPALALVLLVAGDASGLAEPAQPSRDAALAASVLLLAAGGVLSGLLAGLLGIGGALVTLPVLHLALPRLGIDPAQVPLTAVATALLAMVPITLLAAWRQHGHGAIQTAWLGRMAAPMVVGAACGALLAATLNGPVLAVMFAAQSMWYGARLLRDRCGPGGRHDHRSLWQRFAQLPPWLAAPPMAGFCACVGMGGGSMVTPFLLRQGLPFRHAVATAGALNACIALAGTLAFATSSVDGASAGACLPAAVLLAAGAMVSVQAGVRLAHHLPAFTLQRLIGIVNLVSALALLCQVARH